MRGLDPRIHVEPPDPLLALMFGQRRADRRVKPGDDGRRWFEFNARWSKGLLARLYANRAELLRVLDRPDIPLHTNGSENDIRCQVIRRKVSGTTRDKYGPAYRAIVDGLIACAKGAGVDPDRRRPGHLLDRLTGSLFP